MKRTRLRAKRPTKRRSVHPVQPVHRVSHGTQSSVYGRIPADLRWMARQEICYVRHDNCRNNPDYTVLAHLRMAGTAGMGMKPDDVLALPVCDIAHDMIDGRAKIRDVNFWKEVLCGYLRWLNSLLSEGYLRR